MLPEPTYTSLTQDFVREVSSANQEMQISVILIGSVARSTHTSQSDLDLLVISDQLPLVERHADRLHVQALTAQQFTERLRAGDDFAAWCVRYGVPIATAKPWLDIVSSAEAAIWPDWHTKVHHAARRLALAAVLLQTEDIAAAGEEMLYAVSHTARAILLKAGVFPLSRPEIISQLRETNHERLAKMLEDLSYQEPSKAALNRYSLYIKRLLVTIDRPAYQEFVQLRRQHLLAKKNRTSNLINPGNGRLPVKRR
ncbi:MAG: nucleotidyltransferase domain-containing protein [Candidatus Acidiferrales bacterium]